ncbi:acyl-CoA dehydrogenase family protein [Mycobacterium vicinigordonae]|uniref:Acyl-CoA dehydrogenase family protein n=1 Tax=Mycobacterium vicinigordonae TaxID=1719132 RepID=A0A7D6E2N2_9MYCO|nr:acyl-CoA dehydrogenase family protein [Mycobacterium vicinigordonae]QLL07406.1 acyl-CoA dehydrogenase family protein [Mycobacterium vicinigordonae]
MTIASEGAQVEQFQEQVRNWLHDQAPRHGWIRRPDSRRQRGGANDAEDAALVAKAKQCQRLLFDAGFAGISWPQEYGGRGLSLREEIAFNIEAASYDLPLGIYVIGLGMCGPTLLALGTAEQKQRHITPLLRGEELWCQMFSEPEAGSDIAGLRMRAVRDGDSWILNGQKIWASGARRCDFGLVLARTDRNVAKHKGITMFIVDMRNPGVTTRPISQMDGGAHFDEVFFADARIPHTSVVGEVNQGWTAATVTLATERLTLGAVRTLNDAPSSETLIDRARHLGRQKDSELRRQLVELWIAERIVGLLSERIISGIMRGAPPGPEGSVAKLVRTDYYRLSAQVGAAIAAAAATAWNPQTEAADLWAQTLLFVPSLSIGGGTDEVLRNVIGERVLGLPKEPQVDRDVPFRELAGKGL